MTIAEMTEMVAGLEVGEPCPLRCRRGLITCPAHLVEVEIDPETGLAWCLCCDTGEEHAPEMQCPCEPL